MIIQWDRINRIIRDSFIDSIPFIRFSTFERSQVEILSFCKSHSTKVSTSFLLRSRLVPVMDHEARQTRSGGPATFIPRHYFLCVYHLRVHLEFMGFALRINRFIYFIYFYIYKQWYIIYYFSLLRKFKYIIHCKLYFWIYKIIIKVLLSKYK